MNATQKVLSLGWFVLSFKLRRARLATLIALLASVIGAGTALVAGAGTAFAAAADETFSQTATIKVPNAGFLPSAAPSATTCGPTATNPFCLTSFDIGFVDPQLGLYFLADRTNATVDQVKTSDNSITQLAKGSFVGVQPGSNTSGPNGVITANDHSEVWAADGVCAPAPGKTCPPESVGTSRVRVIDLETGKVTHNIDTGGQRRADELCEDPQHHVVLVANDDDLDLLLTFISTETYKVIKQIKLDGSDSNAMNIKALNGIEQCQWSPRTGKFYLAIPQVPQAGEGTPGANDTPGAVLEIDPASRKVEKVFPIDFGFIPATKTAPATADCLGPQGLAIGPSRQILLGCSNSGAGTVIINENSGSLTHNLPGLNGNDEVWYNPGDNHYFLAGGNHNVSTPTPGPILGVVDADGAMEDAAATTKSGSHSVAADPVKNQVYVPVNNNPAGSAAVLCGAGATTGCIAVFTAASDNDDHGICGNGKAGGVAFHNHVCPANNGHPGNNGHGKNKGGRNNNNQDSQVME
jgi:hypothetical protein